jgi:hypothetical protein
MFNADPIIDVLSRTHGVPALVAHDLAMCAAKAGDTGNVRLAEIVVENILQRRHCGWNAAQRTKVAARFVRRVASKPV